jgi:predicted kinase
MKTPDRTWGRYVVVSGPAASGKTVLAQAISAELEWPRISKDEIKEALAGCFHLRDCRDCFPSAIT